MTISREINGDIKKIAKGGLISVFGSIIGRGSFFISQIVIIRLLGAEVFGLYVIGFTVAKLAEIISRFGLDVGSIRLVSIYNKNDAARLKGTILGALGISFLGSIVISILLYFSAGFISEYVFHKPRLNGVIHAFAICIPFVSTTFVAASATQGFHTTKYAVYVKEIFQPITNLILILVFSLMGLELMGVVYAFAVSYLLAFVFSLYLLKEIYSDSIKKVSKPVFEIKSILIYSAPLMFAGVLNYLLSWTDILMLGHFVSNETISIYRAASLVPLLMILVLNASNSIYAPVIADLSYKGEKDRLEGVLKLTTRWIYNITLPALIIMIFYSKFIMAIFGVEFIEMGAPILITLALAQFVNCITGGVGYTLAMTGRQNIESKNIFILLFTNIALNCFLIPEYGAFGAAISTGVSVFAVNLLRLIEVYYLHKIHPYNKDYLQGLVAACISIVILFFLSHIDLPTRYSLLGIITIIGIFFVSFLLSAKAEADKYILSLLKIRFLNITKAVIKRMNKTVCFLLILFFIVTVGKVEAITFGIEYGNLIRSPSDYSTLARMFTDIDIRATKIQQILWRDIEPDAPREGVHRYTWGKLDNLIKAFQSVGVTDIEIVLQSTSSWGIRSLTEKERLHSNRGQRKWASLPPKKEHWEDYSSFVGNIVERYDGDGIDDMPGLRYPVLSYEIETEAQGSYFWRAGADEYLDLIKTAYKAAKVANPKTSVILSGLVLGDVPYSKEELSERLNKIKKVDTADGGILEKALWTRMFSFIEKVLEYKDYFDSVEIHSLGNFSEIYEAVKWISKEMKRHGYKKPIYVGDASAAPALFFGPVEPYPTPFSLGPAQILRILADMSHSRHKEINAWYRAEQSRLLVKKAVAAIELGLEKINFGTFADAPLAGTWRGKIFARRFPIRYNWMILGILDKNYKPYPAYFTYKLTANMLGDARFVKRIAFESDAYGVEFTSKEKPVYVLWSDKKETVRFTLDSSFKTIIITNIVTEFGHRNPQVEIKKVKNGNVDLNLTPNPFFVESL